MLTNLKKKAFENIVGKGENAGNQHFLLFPTTFSTLSKREIMSATFVICKMLSNWSSLKFCCLEKS